jgi:hypothetical protein
MTRGQTDLMRELLGSGLTDDEIDKEYAAAEVRGDVARASNVNGLSPEQYARKVRSNVRNKDARKAARRASKARGNAATSSPPSPPV